MSKHLIPSIERTGHDGQSVPTALAVQVARHLDRCSTENLSGLLDELAGVAGPGQQRGGGRAGGRGRPQVGSTGRFRSSCSPGTDGSR